MLLFEDGRLISEEKMEKVWSEWNGFEAVEGRDGWRGRVEEVFWERRSLVEKGREDWMVRYFRLSTLFLCLGFRDDAGYCDKTVSRPSYVLY